MILPYLEISINTHCNLNCNGCGNFSNIASKTFYDVTRFENDFKRLSILFENIKVIRLLGGEPLLNPDVLKYVRIARDSFPNSKVLIVTNGLLLHNQPTEFWETLSDLNIRIDLSRYKTLSDIMLQEIELLCQKYKIFLNVEDVNTFTQSLNLREDTDKTVGFNACIKLGGYCLNLKNGHIFLCAPAAYVSFFNEKFGTTLFEEPGIDIHNHTAEEIIEYNSKPSEACKWCSYNPSNTEWKNEKTVNILDWVAKDEQ